MFGIITNRMDGEIWKNPSTFTTAIGMGTDEEMRIKNPSSTIHLSCICVNYNRARWSELKKIQPLSMCPMVTIVITSVMGGWKMKNSIHSPMCSGEIWWGGMG